MSGGFYNPVESGGSIEILEGGSSVAGSASSIDFTGAGVSVTAVGNAVTVNIPGGGSLTMETPVGTIDGANKVFTTTNEPKILTLNGAVQTPAGVDYTLSGAYTITFVNAPESGSILRSYY